MLHIFFNSFWQIKTSLTTVDEPILGCVHAMYDVVQSGTSAVKYVEKYILMITPYTSNSISLSLSLSLSNNVCMRVCIYIGLIYVVYQYNRLN